MWMRVNRAASVSSAVMNAALERLAIYGLNPDIIMPAGLAISQPDSGFLQAEFASADALLRGVQIIIPDEPSLRDALTEGAEIAQIGAAQLAVFYACCVCGAALNLRSGIFAKKKPGVGITTMQWRILGWTALAGLAASLFLALTTYWQYDRAVNRENATALAAAQKAIPQISDAEGALAALDREMIRKGAPGRTFTAPASALFAEIQAEQGVTLRDMRYGANGILSFTIAAPTVDPINRILAVLQQKGYKVTATPRQEASGLTMADISMRTP
ncbi:MAG: hypothetical protein HC843_07410 [Sphingomonadales bacterium]|nr:hypothetical protein [Sphingomonadales bacterium]